jgi:hypothetical protein
LLWLQLKSSKKKLTQSKYSIVQQVSKFFSKTPE